MDISRRGFLKLLGITGVTLVTKPKLDIPELPKEPPKAFPYTTSGSCYAVVGWDYGLRDKTVSYTSYRNTQYVSRDRVRCKCCGKYQVRGKLDCPHCGAEYDEPIGFDWN